MRAVQAGALFLFAALALNARAVSLQTPAEPDTARWTVIDPEQDFADLLDACSNALGVTIEYSKADVVGMVTIRLPGPVTANALWEFTNRALTARGLTSVQLPGSPALSVVKLADAAALARLEDSARIDTQAGFVKVLVQLGHERTDSIGDAIKLVLTKTGAVTAFKDTRSLLVSDLRANVLQAIRVIAQLDSSFDDMNVIEVPVAHTSPTALSALIDRVANTKKAVFGEKGKGAVIAHPEGKSVLIVAPAIELDVWRGLVTQFDRAEPSTTVNYSPRRFALTETAKLIEQVVRGDARSDDSEPWRLVIDPLTGTLIITTTPSRHAQVEALLDRLETMAQSAKRPIRSYPIKNRSVEELHGLLQGLLNAGALKSTEKPDALAPTVQGTTAPIPALSPPPIFKSDDLGDKVILTIDKATNRLIAMGESRLLEQLETLVKELDVRQPQVLVEALVVAMTDSQTRAVGVELQKVGVTGDIQYQLSNLFGLGSPNPELTFLPPASGTGFGGVVLDPGNFSAVVRAIETVNEGRSLTIPKILVDNNQAANLNSVLQTPYASTNASSTVATTSFGGSLDAGTQITVTPQIAAGGQLVLDYSISLSSFVGAASIPTLPPPRQENSLKSVATVPDGYTVVVGGLEIATESEATSRVPLLGSIPLLGALFRDNLTNGNKTRFYVFLRCNVMRASGFEDLKYASQRELAAAKVDDGMPKLEPRIIR